MREWQRPKDFELLKALSLSIVRKKRAFKWCTLCKAFHDKDKEAWSRREKGERERAGVRVKEKKDRLRK